MWKALQKLEQAVDKTLGIDNDQAQVALGQYLLPKDSS
jgi:hypothetical protein